MPDRATRALILSLLFLALLPPISSAWAEEEAGRTVAVESWLRLGPVDVPWPVFSDEGEAEKDVAQLFTSVDLDESRLWPKAGDSLDWPAAGVLRWHEAGGAEGLLLQDGPPSTPQSALAAFYLSVDRYTELTLKLHTHHLLRVYVDGEQKAEKTSAEAKADDEAGEATASLELVAGKHLILARLMADPGSEAPWRVQAELELAAEESADPVLDLDPRHALRVVDLLDGEGLRSATLSADGEYMAVVLRQPAVPAEDGKSWVEIRRAKDGQLVRSLRGLGSISGFRWGPLAAPALFSWVERDGGKATLWVGGLRDTPTRAVLEGVEHFGGHRWLPDARGFVYDLTTEAEPAQEEFKRYRSVRDRWAGFGDKSHLYELTLDGGVHRRLTAGAHNTSIADISPDAKHVLFTRSVFSDAEWPYSRTQLYELELATLALRSLADIPRGLSVSYSPDGKRLLISAGPTAFGDIGTNVPEGTVPNDYDTQAYLMDRESGEITPLTRDFDPSISELFWSAKDGRVYARATVGEYEKLFRCDPEKGTWEELPTPVEVVDSLELSADGSRMCFYGTGTNAPTRVYVAETKGTPQPRQVLFPDAERYALVVGGEVTDLDFEMEDGTTIVGRVYYPPHFDDQKRWPGIVYYYGGTSPVTRDFGGRYPKEYWAANGYVVYVLQPSGATGFGQEFSARHVNNWGLTVVDEIVEGTKKFLEANPAVDPERVGCIGASYGGFMTMLLITHTDMYAAAISHAGISGLASYWGEGDWGYVYGSAATAHSYPWNRRDLYVDQSPLFRADKVTTPLLLLHGDIDNNVPPGESEQMYTALRLLGRDVEYLRVSGESHWILNRDRREVWSESIVAYFDWKLKEQPGFWEHLHGEE